MWNDVRFGLRLLRRSPGITAAIAISLALGLGASTAMFSLLNSLMWKALPVPAPDRLVVLNHGNGAELDSGFTYPQFSSLHDGAAGAIELLSYAGGGTNRMTAGTAERKVETQFVSGDYFRVLRIQPAAGRLLAPGDQATVVISYRLWQSAFHGDAGAIGRSILINSVPFTIAGVAPRTFFGVETGSNPDVILPFPAKLLLDPKFTMFECYGCYWISVMGRIPAGGSVESAGARLAVLWKNFRQAAVSTFRSTLPERYRASYFADHLVLVPGATGISFLRARFSQPLYVLITITALILLISCSNVANLLLARAQARRRELAVRQAIGAPRWRLVRQLLTESALLAVAGLVAAALVYRFCVAGLLDFMRAGGQTIYLDTAPDLRLAAFASGAAILTLALFGLLPAVRATRRPASRSVTARSSFARVILGGQIALSFILLVGAILLARSLYDLHTFSAGFRRDHLLMVSPQKNMHTLAARDLLEQVGAIPGVRAASESVVIPMAGGSWQRDYTVDGSAPAAAPPYSTYLNIVLPDFFRTMGTRILMGRDLTLQDDRGATRVALVNQSFARQYWRDQNPIGRQFHEADKRDLITVVGVVEDAKYRDFRKGAPATIYLPLLQQQEAVPGWGINLEIWTQADPHSLIRPVSALLHGDDATIRTFTELIDRRLLYERLLSVLSISFGALGVLICAVGIYGVAAYSVGRRTAEIGIRMAVGATPAAILRLILGEQGVLLILGLGVGAAGAAFLTRFLRTWLFGISPTDPGSIAAGVITLAAITALASCFPARHAAAIEPLRALRHD